MEPTPDRQVEDIAIHANFNPNEVSSVFNKYSDEDKEKISKSLLEDFKRPFFQTEPPVNKSILYQKAHLVSCLGFNYCATLDNDFKNFVIWYLKKLKRPQLLNIPSDTFLKSLATSWEIFIEAITITHNVMEYMKSFHSGYNKLEHFDIFAVLLFRNIIFQDGSVQKCFQARLSELKQVTTRDNKQVTADRLLIESISKMCYALKMDECYKSRVKPLFLKLTTEYFQLLRENYLLIYHDYNYFINANAKIVEEMDRIQSKLDTDSINEIRDIITTELVLKNINAIMKSCSVDYMLKNDQYDNLKHLYNILCSVDGGLKVMFDSMCPYFCDFGTSIVLTNEGISNDFTCIQGLLSLKDKFDYLMNNVFNNNKLFYDIVGNEFSVFLKLNSSIPTFLCQFIDEKLRKGKFMFFKNHTPADLFKVAFLAKHLQDKSSFEKLYESSLAMRLLDNVNVSTRMENTVIRIFKRVYADPCDNSLFVSRIQRMCKDKFLSSKFIKKKYNEHVLVDKVILGIMRPFDLNVDILSAVYCQVVSPQPMCKVPSFAMNAFKHFNELYSRYETKKNLKLLPQYGTAELEVTCYSQLGAIKRSYDEENSKTKIERGERKIKVVVSTYEMFVLDLFNSNDFLTGETILKETMIPKDSLLVSLGKLVNDHKLLIKRPICKEIKLSDTFYVREDL
ncbi:hypothetical protein AGLY_012722 [Aphis glycines]|uniref:Cullin family profile domain-containing protein n=2 Tax=Aphis glycines TaxID=307491 RepID=A0A6G0TAJ2_APHGL|nr:hypothetical protein AGLY_012722 [Aphis glycines]